MSSSSSSLSDISQWDSMSRDERIKFARTCSVKQRGLLFKKLSKAERYTYMLPTGNPIKTRVKPSVKTGVKRTSSSASSSWKKKRKASAAHKTRVAAGRPTYFSQQRYRARNRFMDIAMMLAKNPNTEMAYIIYSADSNTAITFGSHHLQTFWTKKPVMDAVRASLGTLSSVTMGTVVDKCKTSSDLLRGIPSTFKHAVKPSGAPAEDAPSVADEQKDDEEDKPALPPKKKQKKKKKKKTTTTKNVKQEPQPLDDEFDLDEIFDGLPL